MIAALAAAELAEERDRCAGSGVHRHQRQAQPPTRPADACELARRAPVVRGENDAERRDDNVERRVAVRQGLRIGDVETDVEILLRRTGAGPFDPVFGHVDSRHTRTRARCEQREASGSCPDVEHKFAGSRVDQLDECCLRPHIPSLETLPRPRRARHLLRFGDAILHASTRILSHTAPAYQGVS